MAGPNFHPSPSSFSSYQSSLLSPSCSSTSSSPPTPAPAGGRRKRRSRTRRSRGRSRSRISRRRDMKRRRSNHGQNERISRRGEEADPCSRRSRDYARPLVRWCYSPLVSWVSGFLPSRVPPAKLTHFTPFSFSFSPAVARKYIPGVLIASFTQYARNTNIAHTWRHTSTYSRTHIIHIHKTHTQTESPRMTRTVHNTYA